MPSAPDRPRGRRGFLLGGVSLFGLSVLPGKASAIGANPIANAITNEVVKSLKKTLAPLTEIASLTVLLTGDQQTAAAAAAGDAKKSSSADLYNAKLGLQTEPMPDPCGRADLAQSIVDEETSVESKVASDDASYLLSVQDVKAVDLVKQRDQKVAAIDENPDALSSSWAALSTLTPDEADRARLYVQSVVGPTQYMTHKLPAHLNNDLYTSLTDSVAARRSLAMRATLRAKAQREEGASGISRYEQLREEVQQTYGNPSYAEMIDASADPAPVLKALLREVMLNNQLQYEVLKLTEEQTLLKATQLLGRLENSDLSRRVSALRRAIVTN